MCAHRCVPTVIQINVGNTQASVPRVKMGAEMDSCKYFHPILCKFSVQKRLCTHDKCTFTHLKGTKRSEQQMNKHQSARIPVNTDGKQDHVRSNSSGDENSATNHFLELKTLVQSMNTNFQQELASIKASMNYYPHPKPLYFQHPHPMLH